MHDEEVEQDRRRLGMSPRQQYLDKLWSYYRCDQYSARTVAWDGSKHVGMVERDTIALAGYIPPGFYMADNNSLPVQFRRPTSPYHLVKVIVDRFTSLLFSNKRHPKVTVDADPATDDFVNAVIEEGRLWPAMQTARAFGGGTGTAVVGFKLVQGRPQFEVFDPRWCSPQFLDRPQLVLSAMEYRYVFVQEIRVGDEWHEVEFWYRRVIDQKTDTIFKPVPVKEQGQPKWVPAQVVNHDLGFCPIVWIQNQANPTEMDGDPDCLGIFELTEAIDRLNAQGEKGTIANADPTVVLTTNNPMGEVRKGSANAIKLEQGGSASYMEMNGGGIKSCRELAEDYKDMALEVAQCVLEQRDRAGQMTATQVERNYSSMLSKADTFREQYGEMGVKRLINMVIVAAKRLMTPRVVNNQTMRYFFSLSKKINKVNGKVQQVDRQLGPGPYNVSMAWPPYFDPDEEEAQKAVTTSIAAKTGGLIDVMTAVRKIAPYFSVEDVPAMVHEITRSAYADQAALEKQALQGPDEVEPSQADTNVQQSAFNGAQVQSLLELTKAVADGEIPAEAALEIIEIAYPVSKEQAMKIVGNLKDFKPKKPVEPVAPPVPGLPSVPGGGQQ